jgi:hypothetical protein
MGLLGESFREPFISRSDMFNANAQLLWALRNDIIITLVTGHFCLPTTFLPTGALAHRKCCCAKTLRTVVVGLSSSQASILFARFISATCHSATIPGLNRVVKEVMLVRYLRARSACSHTQEEPWAQGIDLSVFSVGYSFFLLVVFGFETCNGWAYAVCCAYEGILDPTEGRSHNKGRGKRRRET